MKKNTKKRIKKLTLSRETLRDLESSETKAIAGGYPSEGIIPTNCEMYQTYDTTC